MNTIISYSMKGGVGKSTTAVNLALGLCLKGFRTLIIDLDPQAAASYYVRTRPDKDISVKELLEKKSTWEDYLVEADTPGLFVLTPAKSLRKLEVQLAKTKATFDRLIKQLSREFDYLVIDSPPQIGILSERLFEIANTILVPVIPSALSIRTYKYLHDFLVKKGLGVEKVRGYFSMVRKQTTLHKTYIKEARKNFPEFLQSTIPQSSEIEKMSETRKPVILGPPSSKAGQAYRALLEELLATS